MENSRSQIRFGRNEPNLSSEKNLKAIPGNGRLFSKKIPANGHKACLEAWKKTKADRIKVKKPGKNIPD
jgi:hypothetical protein